MKLFGFNIDSFIWSFMPVHLRKDSSIFSLYQALLYPFRYLMATFIEKQRAINAQITYNNQHIYLETALNDKFNVGHNGIFDALNNNIYIDDNEIMPNEYLFIETELTEYDGFEDLETESIVDSFDLLELEELNNVHYLVQIPTSLGLDLLEVESYINKYNPVGKIFHIITY